MVILGDSWPIVEQEEIPIINNDEELKALYRAAKVRQLPSDEEKYDEGFPEHPLSRVRARLRAVEATAKLNLEGGALRSFRIQNA